MLYHLTARCILLKLEGGLEIEVLFIDTDDHFDILWLLTIFEHRLIPKLRGAKSQKAVLGELQ